MRGQLLREISAAQLAALGVDGVTSMAWISRNKLLVGMQEGNRIAVLNTAPASAKSRIADVYRDALNVAPGVDIEPPGEDAEADILRTINDVEVDGSFAVGMQEGIAPDSLGAVAYDEEAERILFSVKGGNATVMAIDMQGGTGKPCPYTGNCPFSCALAARQTDRALLQAFMRCSDLLFCYAVLHMRFVNPLKVE